MKNSLLSFRTGFLVLLVALTVGVSSGCIQEMAQLLYVIKGHKVAAEFPHLSEKRVAIVTVSEASSHGPDPLAKTISKYVGFKLANSTDDITVIAPAEVEEFIDLNGWKESDVAALGKKVKADYVMVVNVSDYSIADGATLFKGRSELEVNVYDIAQSAKMVYTKGPNQFVFPENGRPVLQTTARRFETFYLAQLTQHISRAFVSHDKMDTFAEDAMMTR